MSENEKACGLSPASLNGLELPRRSATITVIVVMTIVMVVTVAADADTDGTNMNADDGGVRRACTQQGQGKNRGDKGFHDNLFQGVRVPPLSPTPAWMTVAGMESPEITIRSKSYRPIHLYCAVNAYFPAFPPARVPGLLARVTI
jgi:hypothetical protein